MAFGGTVSLADEQCTRSSKCATSIQPFPARRGHVSIFNIGAQRAAEKKRGPRAEDAEERRDELGEPKVPAHGGHVSIFNIGEQRTGEN
jgi:hypothetical protein